MNAQKARRAPVAAVPQEGPTPERGQNLSTLRDLLSQEHEEILGPGEVTWCLMTSQVLVGGRAITDTDITAARVRLEVHQSASGKPLKFTAEDVERVLALVAQEHQVHPIQEWLKGLRWDRVSRVGEIAKALGQSPDGLQALLLRRWLVSAVARALKPGEKVDTVLVLVGAQGVGKSTFFSALAGPGWHTDSPVAIGDKDGMMVMREAWIVEWAELDSLRRARDQEAVKAFLSSSVDTFRPPYGHGVVKQPRHCVITGSTNSAEFLYDSSGSRRFWPVTVPGRIDLDWVKANRDQVWAEAVNLYQAGERWWLDEEEAAQLVDASVDHLAQDPWIGPIEDWLEQQGQVTEVTTAQLLGGALEKRPDTWGRADETRVGAILRQLGWTDRQRVRRGEKRPYVYRRPGR